MNSPLSVKTCVGVCTNVNVVWLVSFRNCPYCICTDSRLSWTCEIVFEEMRLVAYQSSWKKKRTKIN